jgi:membrane-associated phospholipid phosphatase
VRPDRIESIEAELDRVETTPRDRPRPGLGAPGARYVAAAITLVSAGMVGMWGDMVVMKPSGGGRTRWMTEVRSEARAVDQAVFDAVAATRTPVLDRFMVALSDAADYSRLWLLTAAVLAVVGGGRGRRAALQGVLAIGLASAVANVGVKPLAGRRRPERSDERPISRSRQVRRPVSTSFPSGHAASAFAFASATGQAAPVTWIPLHLAAGLVAYSRVHTGMHYPSDVATGAVLGAGCGWTVRRLAGQVPAAWCRSRRAP